MAGAQILTIVGHVGRDCEMRYTQAGAAVSSFTVAVTRKFGSGENRTEKTTWFKCTVWNKQAEIANQYVRKGTLIYCTGTVDVSAYTDKNGNPAASLEMTVDNFQLLGGRGDAGSGEPQTHGSAAGALPDDIPFF